MDIASFFFYKNHSLMKYSYASTLLMSALSISSPALADNEIFPYPARLFAAGSAGTTAGSSGDFMLPVFGNANGMFYGDIQAKYYRDQSWFTGAAGGFRTLFNGKQILGGYLFVDRNTSVNDKLYWILSPGIEGINQQWDAHINGYFPFNKKKYVLGNAWADSLGDYRFVRFSGHQQFDHIFVNTEEASRGADAELGYRVSALNDVRLAVGGYYFDFPNMNNMQGVIGTVEYPLNERISVLAQDSYDNLQHNTFMLSVRLRFSNIPDQGINDRMLDPIRRNLGTLGSGTSIPTERAWLDSGRSYIQNDRLWFFRPGGTTYQPLAGFANCTAEHPCGNTQLTQTTIDSIDSLQSDARLFLASGLYPIDPGNEFVILNQGQSIEGRTSNYLKPAQADDRPLLIGSLTMNGYNRIANIIMDNRQGAIVTTQSNAILIRGNVNLIENSMIGRPGTVSGYITTVDIRNAGYVAIRDSSIYSSSDLSEVTTGVVTRNVDQLDISNTLISVKANAVGNLNVFATGVILLGRSQLTVTDTIFDINARANVPTVAEQQVVAQGIFAKNVATVRALNNTFVINANATRSSGGLGVANALGINNSTTPSSLGPFVATNNDFFINAASTYGIARAWGIRQPHNAQPLIFRDNQFFLRTSGLDTRQQYVGP